MRILDTRQAAIRNQTAYDRSLYALYLKLSLSKPKADRTGGNGEDKNIL
jgi:hypothetical protein